MGDLFNLNPKVSTALAVLIAYVLIDDLNAPEQGSLGNWFMLLGQTIVTNAASQSLIERRSQQTHILNINSNEMKKEYSPLYYDIKTVVKIINEHYPNHINNLFVEVKAKIEILEEIINTN